MEVDFRTHDAFRQESFALFSGKNVIRGKNGRKTSRSDCLALNRIYLLSQTHSCLEFDEGLVKLITFLHVGAVKVLIHQCPNAIKGMLKAI